MFGPKVLLSTLTEEEKDELLKLVLQELIHTIKDVYPTEKRTAVLSVEIVHSLITDTIHRLNYYNQPKT